MKQIDDMSREDAIVALKNEMFKNNLLHQEVEALGCESRIYFYERFKRDPRSDDELMEYYVNSGGAKAHRERMKQ